MSNKLLIGGVVIVAGGLLLLGKFSGINPSPNNTASINNIREADIIRLLTNSYLW